MAAQSRTRGRPAQTLGLPPRYQPIQRIARGGMSTLWCTQDTLLERRVAVKLLSGALDDDPAARRRFDREARAAAALSSHSHVVTIFDVGETVDAHRQPYIVMEYRSGGSLAEARADGPVARERVLRWITQAAAALDAAHRQGIVHRDVKPGNLLLDGRDDVAIADFGIAHLIDEGTLGFEHQLFGTAAYLSPEQVRGDSATPASDRYALGVVAFELLTGRRPFAGDSFATQAASRLEQAPPAPSAVAPGLPRAVDPVLARALSRAPADRWPSARAFAVALNDAFAAPRAVERPPATATRVIPSAIGGEPTVVSRRRGGRLAAALTLLLGGAALAAVLIASGGGSGAPSRSHVAAGRGPAAPVHHRAAPHAARPKPVSTQPTEQTTRSQTATAPVSSATTVPPSAVALETRGHALLEGGNPATAVPVLQRAVAAASSGSLTDAYALFDLGRALRLSGDPAAAIPVLARRLAIPDQTGLVRRELALARAATRPRPAPKRLSGGAAIGPSGGPPAVGRHGHRGRAAER